MEHLLTTVRVTVLIQLMTIKYFTARLSWAPCLRGSHFVEPKDLGHWKAHYWELQTFILALPKGASHLMTQATVGLPES